MKASVLVAGPASVRLVGDPTEADVGPAAAAALAALDDPVALLEGRPVDVTALWREVVAAALGERRGPVTVVHPSWWPPARVRRVLAAVVAVAGPAVPISRAEILNRDAPRPVAVVEFAGEVVAVTRPAGSVRVLARDDLPGIAGAARGGHVVLVDAPGEVPGASGAVMALRRLLTPAAVECVDVLDVLAPAPSTARTGRPRVGAVAAGAVLLAAAAAMAALSVAARPGPEEFTLVEGRIAVDVPAGWPVRRVTDGPGSRRVEVVSPSDGAAMLHITGAYAPETSVAEAARVVARAVAAAPPGVFVDVRTDARVAGRPAITYRERRAAREVLWTVVVDGAMRISIGCQSPPRGPGIGAVCEAAIGSARDTGAF